MRRLRASSRPIVTRRSTRPSPRRRGLWRAHVGQAGDGLDVGRSEAGRPRPARTPRRPAAPVPGRACRRGSAPWATSSSSRLDLGPELGADLLGVDVDPEAVGRPGGQAVAVVPWALLPLRTLGEEPGQADPDGELGLFAGVELRGPRPGGSGRSSALESSPNARPGRSPGRTCGGPSPRASAGPSPREGTPSRGRGRPPRSWPDAFSVEEVLEGDPVDLEVVALEPGELPEVLVLEAQSRIGR